jgi:hypothetical protein
MDAVEIQAKDTIAAALIISRAVELPCKSLERSVGARRRQLATARFDRLHLPDHHQRARWTPTL